MFVIVVIEVLVVTNEITDVSVMIPVVDVVKLEILENEELDEEVYEKQEVRVAVLIEETDGVVVDVAVCVLRCEIAFIVRLLDNVVDADIVSFDVTILVGVVVGDTDIVKANVAVDDGV